jgi:hypothetical protein
MTGRNPTGGSWGNIDTHTSRKLMPHKKKCELCGALLKKIDGKWVCVTETCGSTDGTAGRT